MWQEDKVGVKVTQVAADTKGMMQLREVRKEVLDDPVVKVKEARQETSPNRPVVITVAMEYHSQVVVAVVQYSNCCEVDKGSNCR